MSHQADVEPRNGASTSGSQAGLIVLGAAFLGVGAMVRAGILALPGQAGTAAGSALWISFLLVGVIAGPSPPCASRELCSVESSASTKRS